MSALIETARISGKTVRVSLPPAEGSRVRLKLSGWAGGRTGTVEAHRLLDPTIAKDAKGPIGGYWCDVRLDEPEPHRAGPIEVYTHLLSWELEEL